LKLWRAVLLMNLALALGIGIGYLAWGRQVVILEEDLARARQRMRPAGVEQVFAAVGVVRALIPEIGVIVLTHDAIGDFMPPMTMGFRARDPQLLQRLAVGDNVRFTLRGVPPNLLITEIAKQGQS